MSESKPKVPFFDLNRVFLEQKEEIEAATIQCLRSGWYILGKEGSSFETALSEFSQLPPHFVGCNSGTDALILALKAAGVTWEHEVIAPAHTAIPTISAIRILGAKPIFSDICPDAWVSRPEDISSLITPQTKAIILVHLYGNMIDVSAVRNVLTKLNRQDVKIIEDVAQAFGSQWNGKYAGSTGDFAAFSFYPTKNLGALGDGGAVYAQSEQDAARLKALRNYGQKVRYNAELPGGMNSRLDEVQAAILKLRLKRVQEWKVRKDALISTYRKSLSQTELRFQKVSASCNPHWHLLVAECADQKTRDALQKHLLNDGIETLIHYPIPTHRQDAFKEFSRSLPNTELHSSRILSLPMNSGTSSVEVEQTIESIRKFYAS